MGRGTQITLQPPVVNLALYAGDGASIRLVVDSVSGSPVPLDGEITAQIRTLRTDVASLADWSVDLSEGTSGVVLLGLTGDQTAALVNGTDFSGVWDVQYIATGEEPLTLVQGKVTVKQDVTRP